MSIFGHVSWFAVLSQVKSDAALGEAGRAAARRPWVLLLTPLAAGAETARNLAEMRRQAAAGGARVIWMTSTACDTARIATYPPFQGQQIWLKPGNLRAVDDGIRATAGDGDMVVDLGGAFGSPPDAGLLRADGLHPTLTGQKVIARRFVQRLAGISQA